MDAATGTNETQSGSSIVDHFIQKLEPYISNNAANVDFQVVQRLRFIDVDMRFCISAKKIIR